MNEDERTERDERVARALRRPVRDLAVPSFGQVEARLGRRRAPAGLISAAVALAVILGLVVGSALEQRRAPVGQPDESASPGASGTATAPEASPSGPATPSPTANPADGLVTYENPILGYRISLPEAYRRSESSVITGHDESLGHDSYTLLTEAEEHEECLRDVGDTPPLSAASYFYIHAYRNALGLSAVEWAGTRGAPASTVEPATIEGHEAARLVWGGETSSYVIRANDRVYMITADAFGWPSPHRLDNIAESFQASEPQPFPTPTPVPSQAPRAAARDLAQRLAQAFAARDADAVADLITSRCHIGVSAVVTGFPQGAEHCCVLNRAVTPFIQALRERFASGDLTVTVDPEVQIQEEGGREEFFVRSEWRDSGRTTQIDLFLDEFDGQWRWAGALHHYQLGDRYYCGPWSAASC